LVLEFISVVIFEAQSPSILLEKVQGSSANDISPVDAVGEVEAVISCPEEVTGEVFLVKAPRKGPPL